nr:uncharacterized protein LOC110090959 isoform X1 [Pogona vitticeps]
MNHFPAFPLPKKHLPLSKQMAEGAGKMELHLLSMLMQLFILRTGQALMTKIVCASGEQTSLPCEVSSSHTRWFWFPLNPTCANISGNWVEIAQNHTTHEVTPLRFNQRLTFYNQKSLLLRNLVMSDAGIYLCRLPNGSETHTELQVDPGCHNNLLVSYEWLHPSLLKLSCHHCIFQRRTDSFRWVVNSKPLGNRRWAKKSNHGSTVMLHPFRQTVWGRWECHSLDYTSWVSEICLVAPIRYMEADFGSADTTSWASFLSSSSPLARTTDVTPTGHALKRIAVWIWTLLLVGLVLLLAALGMAVWLKRKHQERKKWTDPTRQKEIMKKENLDEIFSPCGSSFQRPASLYYAQLQHPRRKSTSIRTADSSTVYAVIV